MNGQKFHKYYNNFTNLTIFNIKLVRSYKKTIHFYIGIAKSNLLCYNQEGGKSKSN